MKLLMYVIIITLVFASCRKETPIENDDLNTDINILPAISIISPVDEDEFSPGEEVVIKWLPQDFRVNIVLYRKTDFQFEIASDVTSSGEYIWVIPDNLDPSVHYRIKIILKENPINSVYSSEFTVKGF